MGWLLLILSLLFSGQLEGQRYYKRPTFAAAAAGLCDDITEPGKQACYNSLSPNNTEQTITDETGNGHDCTRGAGVGSSTDDPTWADNDSDGEFDNLDYEDAASDDFLLCSAGPFGNTDLYADGEDFTVWIVYNWDDNVEFTVLFSVGESAANAPLNIEINTFDATRIRLKGSDTNVENQTANTWAMLWVQCDDGSTCRYCVNDEADASCETLNVGAAIDPNKQVSIGCGNEGVGTSCLDGQTTALGIHDAYLTEAQRQSLYATVQSEHSTERNITLP